MQTSGETRREIAKVYPRHCDVIASAAKQSIGTSHAGKMDCFAALAMTALSTRNNSQQPLLQVNGNCASRLSALILNNALLNRRP